MGDQIIAALGGDSNVSRVLILGSLVAARIAPLTILAPWIALKAAAAPVRASVMLALTISFGSIAFSTVQVTDIPGALWPMLMMREMLVGLVFAIPVAMPFYAVEWAGALIDLWRGASMSQIYAPPTAEETSPLGEFYLFFAIAIFTALGGHRAAFEALGHSFELIPIAAPVSIDSLVEVVQGTMRIIASGLTFAASVAAPAAVTLLMTEIGFGLIARAAPQVPIYFTGMPLRAAVGLAAVMITLSFVAQNLPLAFRKGVDDARGLTHVLSGEP